MGHSNTYEVVVSMYQMSHILQCNQAEIHRELLVLETRTVYCFTGKPGRNVLQHT